MRSNRENIKKTMNGEMSDTTVYDQKLYEGIRHIWKC
jgi:hypothetical protein